MGRALATTEDPDYDVSDNKLYTGEQNIMVRPYPLPGSVKVRVWPFVWSGPSCGIYGGQALLPRRFQSTVLIRRLVDRPREA